MESKILLKDMDTETKIYPQFIQFMCCVRFAINSKSDIRFASEANQTSDLLFNLENGKTSKMDLKTSRMHLKMILKCRKCI